MVEKTEPSKSRVMRARELARSRRMINSRQRRRRFCTQRSSACLPQAGGSQDTADSGDIGEHVQTQDTFDERIVFVKPNVAQSSVTCKHVDDEQKCNASIGENGGTLQKFEADFQTRLELKDLKELPEENQACKGREALLFVGKTWDGTIVAEDGLSAVFHAGRLPFPSLSWLTHDNIRKTGLSRFTILRKMSNVTGCDVGCCVESADLSEGTSISYVWNLCNTGVNHSKSCSNVLENSSRFQLQSFWNSYTRFNHNADICCKHFSSKRAFRGQVSVVFIGLHSNDSGILFH